MKKFLRNIPLVLCICLLIAGIIGLLIPFDFENFSFDKATSNATYPKMDYLISFDIDNSSEEEYEDVIISITYKTKSGHSYKIENTEIRRNLNKDDNEITFSHSSTNSTSTLVDVTNVKLTLNNGKSFEIYNRSPLFSGINWVFNCLIIVGFFGGAICFALGISKRRAEIEQEDRKKSLNERIKEAFTPVVDTINTIRKTYEDNINNNEENKVYKITCPYCKGKYDSTEGKCPHCGAPPEPYD